MFSSHDGRMFGTVVSRATGASGAFDAKCYNTSNKPVSQAFYHITVSFLSERFSAGNARVAQFASEFFRVSVKNNPLPAAGDC